MSLLVFEQPFDALTKESLNFLEELGGRGDGVGADRILQQHHTNLKVDVAKPRASYVSHAYILEWVGNGISISGMKCFTTFDHSANQAKRKI